MRLYYCILNNAVNVSNLEGNKTVAVLHNIEEFNNFYDEQNGNIGGMCSSSIDFAEEFTDDPDVIALCDAMRRSD